MIFIMIRFKTKPKNLNLFKCCVCGKFMKSEDMLTKYIPDTAYTIEEIMFFHIKCKDDIPTYASI